MLSLKVARAMTIAALTFWGLASAVAEPVRIAHDQRFPPFAEVKDGRSEGLAVDVLRAAAEKAGLDLVLVAVPFAEIQKTLEDGRADAVFPLAINPERAKTFDFSAPLLVTGGALFVRAPDATPAFASLAGKTVTTPRTGPLAGYIEKNFPNVKLLVTADYDESLKQLTDGQADAAALNFQAGARIAALLFPGKVTEPRELFWELPLAVAVPKGKGTESIAKIDAGLKAIRSDGTWQKINDRWMGK